MVSMPAFSQEAQEDNSSTPEAEVVKTGFWDDIVYGSPDAKVELIEYASLTCGHCGHFAQDMFPKLKEKYIDTGKVRLRFRNFMLNQMDFMLTLISRCTDEDQAKKLTNTFLTKQDRWLGQPNAILILEALAAIDGMPLNSFEGCLQNRALGDHLIKKREAWSLSEAITHTPTIKIDGTAIDAHSWESIEAAIEAKLAE